MSEAAAEACRWCGAVHQGEHCPLIKALEFDPTTGAITRVEYLTPADHLAARLMVQPEGPGSGENYPRLGNKA